MVCMLTRFLKKTSIFIFFLFIVEILFVKNIPDISRIQISNINNQIDSWYGQPPLTNKRRKTAPEIRKYTRNFLDSFAKSFLAIDVFLPEVIIEKYNYTSLYNKIPYNKGRNILDYRDYIQRFSVRINSIPDHIYLS